MTKSMHHCEQTQDPPYIHNITTLKKALIFFFLKICKTQIFQNMKLDPSSDLTFFICIKTYS